MVFGEMVSKWAAITKIRTTSNGFLRKPRIFIIGYPGSGRSTQAQLLSD